MTLEFNKHEFYSWKLIKLLETSTVSPDNIPIRSDMVFSAVLSSEKETEIGNGGDKEIQSSKEYSKQGKIKGFGNR